MSDIAHCPESRATVPVNSGRITGNSEVTGVHEKRLCARPAPDAEVETATVPSIVQTATQATGWIAG